MNSHPEWLNKALFYEVYPQSFFDSNGDGIGDLKGIQKKLDYIKNLGFNALWLNPIYESPFKDAGYDITVYKKVAKRYGTNRDAYDLFKAAHEKGMKVILDFVPGHTSLMCPWFRKSCEGKENEFTSRYIWTDSVWKTPKDLPVLRGISDRDGAVVTNFFSVQPALNYGFASPHESYEEPVDGKGPQGTITAMIDILRFWLRHGADGFRCDMAGSLVKHDPDHSGTIRVWRQIIDTIKNDFPDAVFVSEWDDPLCSLRAGFDMDFLLQDPFNPYNSLLTRTSSPYFRFDNSRKDAKAYFDNFRKLYAFASSQQKFLSLISGNHDTKRLASFLSPEEMKFYYLYLFTMPNVPFLYYGDEIGMKYEEGLLSVEGGFDRTGNRSPMQWDETKMAGFTSGRTSYIRIPSERAGISVREEAEEDDSLFAFLKTLLSFRKDHVAFDNDASFELVETKGYCPLVYIRKKFAEKLLIAINPSPRTYKISLGDFRGNPLFSSGGAFVEEDAMKLSPQSFIVLE